MSNITQEALPAHYNPLRGLLSALSEEIHQLKGSYCTKVIRPFSAGDGTLYVETSYGFPSEGTVYANGLKIKYKGVDTNKLKDILHSEDLVSLAVGEVVSLVSPVSNLGEITKGFNQLSLSTASGAMLDVLGTNHAVPRYFGIGDSQYRALIEALAYMAGKGTQDSIEAFLDAVLDHKSVCGSGEISQQNDGTIRLVSTDGTAPFGSILKSMFIRVDLAFLRPNGEMVRYRFKVGDLVNQQANTEFYSELVLEEKKSPEFDPANILLPHFTEQGNDVPCIWRIVPYRVWEDPYKRYERDANAGERRFAPSRHNRQTVGNTVLVDLHLAQENSPIGAGYLSGQLILKSSHPQGLASPQDNRIRLENGEVRLYLEGEAVGFGNEDGLLGYLKTFPRQVLGVRRVIRSGSLQSEQSYTHSPDVFYVPYGSNLCTTDNNWVDTGSGFYVVLNHNVDPHLNQFFNNQAHQTPIHYLQVDVGEVDRPEAPHSAGLDPLSGGSVGVAGGVATAQIMPSENVTNPSFVPPSVKILATAFPAVGNKTLQVTVTTNTGNEFIQRLSFPADIEFNEFIDGLHRINGESDSYILDFYYSAGYQVDGVEVLGNRLFSHHISTSNEVSFYLKDNVRSFVLVENVENNDTNNIHFGFNLPYIDPDPTTSRRRIDYYPLYLGERSVLLLSLLEDLITVSGVIPEVFTRTFQNYASHIQSWRALIAETKTRSL